MEEEKKLYPFRMIPLEEGDGEIVQLADLGYQDSQIRNGWLAATTLSEAMEMYMDRIVGDGLFAWYGRQFPLSVKFIDSCRVRTPLMVCPDNETAEQRYDFLGKDKLWYVQSTTPGAELFLGFASDTDATKLFNACCEGKAETLLKKVTPVPGQFYHISTGTVHAARGVRLVEVAQSSPMDFRIYNWGLPQQSDEFDASLNLEAAIDFITYDAVKLELSGECDFFSVRELPLTDPVRVCSPQSEGPIVYSCLGGKASIQSEGDNSKVETLEFAAGECVLIPAEVRTFMAAPCEMDTVLLEIIPRMTEEMLGSVMTAPEDTGEEAPDHQLHIMPEE